MLKNVEHFIQKNSPLLTTFFEGYREFRKSGKTPEDAYLAMRALYVNTNGWFNDIFNFAMSAVSRKTRMPLLKGRSILQGFSEDSAVRQLKREGFFVFPQTLDSSVVEDLVQYSLSAKPTLQSADEWIENSEHLFDPNNLIASNYRFPENGVISIPAVQMLMSDRGLLNISNRYFGCTPQFVNVSMWWTTPYKCTEPSSTLAQLYHFDMDRIKFMKFFVYLTDVDENNGPHSYVRGSCSRKPTSLLEDRRFQDAEINSHFKKADLVEICGPKGTVIAVDTRGFHKAKLPTAGNRLILQLELTTSLFGQSYGRSTLDARIDALENAIARHPHVYANYHIARKAIDGNRAHGEVLCSKS